MNRDLVFFGNERLASGCTTELPILSALLAAGHTIKLIVINERGAKSRQSKKLEVEDFASENEIELYSFDNSIDLAKRLISTKCDIAVLAAFGRIIKPEVLDIFKAGILNLHPSLLPKYRGPTPIESAILNGDAQTGVSIMKLGTGMDDGPIYSQINLQLSGSEGKQELADSLGKLGAEEIVKILSQTKLPVPSDQFGNPVVCNLISSDVGLIDTKNEAQILEREIRAYAVWPGSRLEVGKGEFVKITQAAVISNEEFETIENLMMGKVFTYNKKRLFLAHNNSKDDEILEILKLQPQGKNEMRSVDFLNGYRNKLT